MSYCPTFETEDQMLNWAIEQLRQRGYAVQSTGFKVEMISPADLQRRYGLKSVAFHKRLHHVKCPPFRSENGDSGRLIWIYTNPELVAWLSQPVRQGRAMTGGVSR